MLVLSTAMLSQVLNYHENLHKIYHGKGSDRAMNHQICHVSDNICSEADVKQHVKYIENFLCCIFCMQISIANGSKGYNRPVHGVSISRPYTPLLKILYLLPNPCIFG